MEGVLRRRLFVLTLRGRLPFPSTPNLLHPSISQERHSASKFESSTSPELLAYAMVRPHPCEAVLRHVAWQLLSAVMDLHENEPPIIHRDLKPDNIAVVL
jgi:hypothetical protein